MKNDRDFSLLLSLISNLTFSSLYILARVFLNLDPNLFLILETSLLYYFFSTSIILILHSNKIDSSLKALLSLCILFLPLFGIYIPEITKISFDILGIIAFLFTIFSASKIFRQHILASLLFSIFFLSYAIWVNSYYSSWTGALVPIISLEAAEQGVLHKDLLYMSSMISMIKSYSVVSTGINGLIENQVHFLALYWHAALSKIYETPSILSLCINAYLTLTPLFFVVFFSAMKASNLSVNKVLSIAGTLIFLDSLIFFPIIINFDYLFSAIIFSFSLEFLSKPRDLKKINIIDLLIALIITSITFVIKPHTAVIIFSVYALSYLQSFKTYPYRIFLSLILILFVVVISIPKDSIYYKYLSGFHPFTFNVLYPKTGFFFAFVLACLILLRISKNKLNFENKFLILSHLTFLIISFNILRGIPDGNNHYFTHALVLLSIYYAFNDEIIYEFFKNQIYKYKNLLLIIFIISNFGLLKQSISNIKDYNNLLLSNPNNQKTQQDILEIKRALTSQNTKNALLYVEPDQKRIWDLVRECSSKAFLFPAYFEVPRILGAPPQNFCALYKAGYGYSAYTNYKSVKLNEKELCDFSLKFNINKIMILSFENSAEIKNITCN